MIVEPLETAADDEAHVFRNVALVDLDVGAELTGRIEDFSLFDQMPIYFLDEERISLALLEDGGYQFLGNGKLARSFQDLRDRVLRKTAQLQRTYTQPNQLFQTSRQRRIALRVAFA